MGYYTRYELAVQGDDCGVDHIESIEIATGYSGLFSGKEFKWYGHEKDMREYSKKYPSVLFSLYGEGKESGDIWVEYHKNGLVQRALANIVLDEFNEDKLA